MSIIRTDYQTPYSQMGQQIGGGLASAGATMGSAIARAPEEARKERLDKLNEEKLRNNRDYTISMMDAGIKDLDSQKDQLTPSFYNAARERLVKARENPLSDKSIKDTETFWYNYGTLLGVPGTTDGAFNELKTVSPDLADYAKGNIFKLDEKSAKQMFSDKDYGPTIAAQINATTTKAKEGKVYDFTSGLIDKNLAKDKQSAYGQYVSAKTADKTLPSIEIAQPIIDKVFEDRDSLAKRDLENKKLKLEGRKVAIEEKKAPAAGAGDNTVKELSDIGKAAETNLIKIFSSVDAGIMDKNTRSQLKNEYSSQTKMNSMALDVATLGAKVLNRKIETKEALTMAKLIISDKLANRPSTDPDVAKVREYIESVSGKGQSPVLDPAPKPDTAGVARTPTAESTKPPAVDTVLEW